MTLSVSSSLHGVFAASARRSAMKSISRPVSRVPSLNARKPARASVIMLSASQARAFVREKRLTFPHLAADVDTLAVYNLIFRYLLDRHVDMTPPTTFLVDDEGFTRVTFRMTGRIRSEASAAR